MFLIAAISVLIAISLAIFKSKFGKIVELANKLDGPKGFPMLGNILEFWNKSNYGRTEPSEIKYFHPTQILTLNFRNL